MNKPLEGLRIVDLTMGWAGPLATRSLADMGAQVIKVESCERFDWWRSWEATEAWIADDGAEKSPQYLSVNRNKLNVTLDLEHPRGRELLLQLVARADALVENYSGGVLPKLKLDYAHLIETNPQIVMVSMPAFGSTGPWSEFRAYGSTVEHSSGLPHVVGQPDQPPTMQHVAFGDAIGGLNGTAAILTALWHNSVPAKDSLWISAKWNACCLSQPKVFCTNPCAARRRSGMATTTRSRPLWGISLSGRRCMGGHSGDDSPPVGGHPNPHTRTGGLWRLGQSSSAARRPQ